MVKPFVHLHAHSHYSLLDGAQHIDSMVARAKELGMTALSLTDHGTLSGSLKFWKECRKQHINPVIGCEFYVTPGSRHERIPGTDLYHLTVLAKNNIGWRNLIKLASTASLDGYYYRPRIDQAALEEYREGLIVLSGCVSSQMSELVLDDNWDAAHTLAAWYSRVFGNDFYMELMWNGTSYQSKATAGLIQVADHMGIPTVASSDSHYTFMTDWDLQDAVVCINLGRPVSAPIEAPRMAERCYYLRSPEEMYAVLPHDACARSQQIADQVDIQIETGVRHFPMFNIPVLGQKRDPISHLRFLCYEGLLERLGPTNAIYTGRLERELKVIHELGFSEYFLIIQDFCEWARSRGIMSTARGSGVGSLVSFCLGISHVDPISHGLLFERFLDPSRREAPDVDIDFDKERRGEVIDYVKRKYGSDCVAQIGTFGTLAAKSAVKEVGKSFLLTGDKITELVDSIPELPNTTLDDATEKNGKKIGVMLEDPKAARVWAMAKRIEGMARSCGTHAAGVVISDKPLIEYMPLMRGKDGGVVSQWDMHDCEDIGLLKMDFLGLRNLTILASAVAVIEEAHGIRIDLNKVVPHAKAERCGSMQSDMCVWEMLQRGECSGVFQLESTGMTDLLMRLKPSNIGHISDCISLYRPGPLDSGMVDHYVNRKNGTERVPTIHPIADQILAPTFGVPIYQETVMMLANQVAGIPLSDAYSLIKAISKKIKDKVEAYKIRFVNGCMSNGVSQQDADTLWSVIAASARYLFNKSHAMAYAYIAYQTAYLKCHYPLEFYAAILDCDISQRSYTGRDPLIEHIEDCNRQGIKILSPHVNYSGRRHKIVDGGIAWSLASVKGVPESAAVAIEQAAHSNPFLDLFDFCRRVPRFLCPRAAIRNLIAIGAMPGDQPRHVMDATIDRAMKLAAGGYKRPVKQIGKWGPEKGVAEPWTRDVELEHERQLTGLYLTGHPIDNTPELKVLGPLAPGTDGKSVVQAGVVTAIETRHTVAKGKEYTTFVLLSNGYSTDCVIWDLTRELALHLVEGKMVVTRGRASAKGAKVGMTVSTIESPGLYVKQVPRFKIAVTVKNKSEVAAVRDAFHHNIDQKSGVDAYIVTPHKEYKYKWKVSPELRLPNIYLLEDRKC